MLPELCEVGSTGISSTISSLQIANRGLKVRWLASDRSAKKSWAWPIDQAALCLSMCPFTQPYLALLHGGSPAPQYSLTRSQGSYKSCHNSRPSEEVISKVNPRFLLAFPFLALQTSSGKDVVVDERFCPFSRSWASSRVNRVTLEAAKASEKDEEMLGYWSSSVSQSGLSPPKPLFVMNQWWLSMTSGMLYSCCFIISPLVLLSTKALQVHS